MNDILKIGDREFTSRLFVGTGKFSSPDIMLEAIKASDSQMITVAMKRVNMMNEASDEMLTHINREHVQLLPNTSGVRNAKEAVLAAQMSREIFQTNFIKLEIHPDPKNLMRLVHRYLIEIIIEQASVPVIVDAGLGAPSHAAEAMELGADAVLVNTAIAVAGDPVMMAEAFKDAVIAGRKAFNSGLGSVSKSAQATSPLTAFLGS